MNKQRLISKFEAVDVIRSHEDEAWNLELKPGQRFAVRYYKEPTPMYDLRLRENVTGNARTTFDVGDKDSGKSAHLEVFGEEHLEAGNKLIDFHGCFLDGTEVLTPSGWKLFQDLAADDLVATCSPVGELEYQRPSARQAYWYSGDMVEIRGVNSRYDLSVTPNHRMLVANYQDERRRHKFITAEQLYESAQGARVRYLPYRMFKSAVWRGGELPCEVNAGSLSLPAAQFMKFLGWYLAEGCTHQNTGVVLSLNPDDLDEQLEVQNLCAGLGFRQSMYKPGQVYLHSRQLNGMLKPLGRANEKYIPSWVKALGAPLLVHLLEAVCVGDGVKQRGKRGCTSIITTVSKRLADDLQEVALKCGYACDVAVSPVRRPTRKADGVEIVPKWPAYRVSYYLAQAAPTMDKRHISKVRRDGMVYCVTVPNGTVLVRRGGKACFTGNSVDMETLGWLRSDWVSGRKVCIVHGPTVKLSFQKTAWETLDVNKMRFEDYSRFDMIISNPKFFMDNDGTKDFTSIGRFLRRLLIHRENDHPIIYCIIREASEVIYSRIKADERQDEVKAQMLSALGQARHIGVSLGLDTQRAVNVDKAFRDLADYTFYKRPRGENLPEEKKFAYRYVDLEPMLVMPRDRFIVVDTRGVGEGVNYMPKWHKREGDVLMPQLGISMEFLEAPEEGRERGDFKTIGDKDHAQMMVLYMDGDGQKGPYSMNMIADEWHISSATPKYQMDKHNDAVRQRGECERCARASGKYAKAYVGRGK